MIFAGQHYGDWTVEETPKVDTQNARVKCRCKCGTKRVVLARSLLSDASLSCGCLRVRLLVKRRQRMLTIGKHTKPITEWAKNTGIPASTINNRLWMGKTPEQSIAPVDKRFRKHNKSK